MSKQYWILKSEPSTYSIDDLINEPNHITPWEGVRNYQARNYLRDSMKVGDLGFFYHSNCTVPAIVGIVEIVRSGYPDKTAFDPKSLYFDPKSTQDNPRWIRVDVEFKHKFATPLSLQTLKNNPKLRSLILVQKGNRLSVMPVTKQEWQAILAMEQ
jgi:predicted RNA-binding protein with PUA-like domain